MFQPSAVHHGDAVGHGERLVLVVGDDDEGDADLFLQAHEFAAHVFAQFRVQRRERLVQEQHLRLHHEGAGEGDALLLSARQLRRTALRHAVQLHERQHFFHAARALVFRDARDLEAVGDILPDAHVRKHRVTLKHHVDRTPIRRQRGDILAVNEDASFARRVKAREHPQERCLAAARGSEEREKFAAPHRKLVGCTAVTSPKRLLRLSKRMISSSAFGGGGFAVSVPVVSVVSLVSLIVFLPSDSSSYLSSPSPSPSPPRRGASRREARA